ncbi:hypothetical protein Cgig2_030889 [Carnegiea gigantea]|uniref:Gnk2-homologous domain-containing protein n=1 Tax=Carnegiea gigantea TaxID=171969 RepID=A0A9Q1GRR9_9CARY|nr:hypothetical protein Cgig2_030889 [Carnegiea gigantea]
MEQNIPTSLVLHFLIILPILFTFTSQISAQFSFLNTQCSNTAYTPNSTFGSNLNQVLNSLSTDTQITYGFYNFSAGQQPNRVEATALCRGDVPLATCQDCVRQSVAGLPALCPNQKEAFGYSENCVLFYSDASIFGRVLIRPSWTLRNGMNVSDRSGLNRTLYGLLARLQNEAASGDSQRKFAAGNVDIGNNGTLYGLVQCNPDLTRLECAQCVQGIMINFQRYVDTPTFIAGGARTVAPSCNLRYEFFAFYGGASPSTQASLVFDNTSKILHVSFHFEISNDL